MPLDFEHCDPALLNAFFCSPDRARSLAAAGLLTADPAGHCPPEPDRIADYLQTGTPLAGNAAAIAAFVGTLGRDAADPYASALTAWLRSCDEALSPADRGRRLLCALDRVELALSRRQSFARALAAARINAAAGQRTRAFELAHLMAQAALRGQAVQIGEPFLALLPEYEANGPGADAVNWLNAMVIEAAARWRAFSSMFAQGYALNDPWAWVSARGFASVALARRHALLALREGWPIDPRARALLESDTPRHRNAAVWRVLLSDPARHLG